MQLLRTAFLLLALPLLASCAPKPEAQAQQAEAPLKQAQLQQELPRQDVPVDAESEWKDEAVDGAAEDDASE